MMKLRMKILTIPLKGSNCLVLIQYIFFYYELPCNNNEKKHILDWNRSARLRIGLKKRFDFFG